MIDWLRRPERASPPTRRSLRVAGRDLPLVIRRRKTARRLSLRLAPDGSEARVIAPPWARIAEVEAFAHDGRDWLAGQLARVPRAEPPCPGGTLRWRGGELLIAWSAEAPRQPALADGVLRVGGPEPSLAARLQRWLEAEALRLCQADAADYAARAGVAPPRLLLSRAKRRWGSCAGDGTVRINWRLVMAPDAVRRSVVAHEIAHLVHFDHGPRFHRLLASLYDDDLAAANRWLKREGRGLYAPFG